MGILKISIEKWNMSLLRKVTDSFYTTKNGIHKNYNKAIISDK